jgi:hypothetical protein
MISNDRREAEEGIRQLEILIADLQGLPATAPSNPEDMLRLLEAAMARSHGSYKWIARAERLAQLVYAPLWDLRLQRQIHLVRELATTTGWNSASTADAIRHLDDLVFARTFGRMVAGPIKRVVREIASKGNLASHELQNLVINNCFRVNQEGRVVVPTERWLFSLGVVQFGFATLVTVPYIALILLSNADAGRQLLGLSIFAIPYWLACWNVRRHFISPYRLIPRAQKLLPTLYRIQ